MASLPNYCSFGTKTLKQLIIEARDSSVDRVLVLYETFPGSIHDTSYGPLSPSFPECRGRGKLWATPDVAQKPKYVLKIKDENHIMTHNLFTDDLTLGKSRSLEYIWVGKLVFWWCVMLEQWMYKIIISSTENSNHWILCLDQWAQIWEEIKLQSLPKMKSKKERKKIPKFVRVAWLASSLSWHPYPLALLQGSGLTFMTTYLSGYSLNVLFLQLGDIMNI